MRWVDETVEAVHDSVGEAFPDQVLGVAALEGDDLAHSVRPEVLTDRCFETGSIGKTFTATLIALAVVDGEVALDDPISRWLDAGANGGITVEQLATHTSGLPRLAANYDAWEGFDPKDPYRGYTAEHAEKALRDVERTDAGTVAYSNFGFQLLGLIAERAFDVPIATLVRDQLFVPLGMNGSGVAGRTDDPVPGHDRGHRRTPAWIDRLPGPGGYESPVADMAAYMRAVLDPPPGRLGDAIRLALQPRVHDDGTDVGLAWHRSSAGLTWHNGGTGGFSSMLAVDFATRRGVVGLLNTTDRGVLDQAVAAAASGADQREHRRRPADDAFDADALAVADLVIAHDYEGVRRRCDEGLAELLSDERMAAAFGPPGEPETAILSREVHQAFRTAAGVTVVVFIDDPDGGGLLQITFDEDRRVVGLLIG